MKRKLFLTTIITFALIVFGAACASAETEGDFTYTVSDGEATVTGGNIFDGELIIPNRLGGCPVTSIGENAFINRKELTNVYIGKGVKSIGKNAFCNCTNLTDITIGDGIISIGDSAFRGCYSLTSITLPEDLTSIGSFAFSECSGLTGITIPEKVTSIGNSAFYNCMGLTSVTIGSGVKSIGIQAFSECNAITKVETTDIAAWCGIEFEDGYSNPLLYSKKLYVDGELITELAIPEEVTSIGNYAFITCTDLKSVAVGSGVKSIGNYAFSGCDAITKVETTDITAWCGIEFKSVFSNPLLYSKKLYVDGELITELVIPEKVTSIGDYAFYNCTGLTSVAVGSGVKSIGIQAFSGCTAITKVETTDIAAWCGIEFENGHSNPLLYSKKLYVNGELITELVIPEEVTSIGNYAFYACTGLTSVTVGSGVTLIPEYAFYFCGNLEYVCLPEELLYIKNSAFLECANIKTVFYSGDKMQWGKIQIDSGNETLANAKAVFNVENKTYSFVTNCDATLPDITNYAVFKSPTVENGDKTFLGWHYNADFTSAPVSFPYYGDATTLYAEWTDRKGTGFDDAFIVKENRKYTVNATNENQYMYFEFTPSVTKKYRLYTIGSNNTYGSLYDSNQNLLKSNNDYGDSRNFCIIYELVAGQKYYIRTDVNGGTWEYSFTIEEVADYHINSIFLTDKSGSALESIPAGSFFASVSFTNDNSNGDTVIVLGQYSENNEFCGLMYVKTKDVPAGSTIELMLPVDNTSGNIAKLKAFCWESFASPAPMGNTVSFPKN